jgi:DNA transposition AAA+ family ATPase
MQTTPPTDTERELLGLAQAIETYRADIGWTKAKFLDAYSELGTDKTYSKIVQGKLAELDLNRWLTNYQHVWESIQTGPRQRSTPVLSDKLRGPVEICRAFLEAKDETDNSRMLLLIGDSGIGKTSAIEVLQTKPYGRDIVCTQATAIWKNKDNKGTALPLLKAIGAALGKKDMPEARADLLVEITAMLNQRRRPVVIEEAHHLCPDGINAIVTLINLTPSVFILTAMPELWDKLESSKQAWSECKQITRNRLAERIVLQLRESDIALLMGELLKGLPGVTEEGLAAAASKIKPEASIKGHLKFVTKVCKRLRKDLAAGEEFGAESLNHAIKAEKARR